MVKYFEFLKRRIFSNKCNFLTFFSTKESSDYSFLELIMIAGMDVNCGSYLKNYTKSALSQKKITEHDVDRALHNLFAVRMRLGLFNGNPKNNVYGNIGPNQVCTKEHQDTALEAARNGIVLLKNSARLLPLSKKISSLAVIGPNADDAYLLLGNYEGPPCKSISVLKALQSYNIRNTVFHRGCNAANCTQADISDAVNTAKNADYVVLVMGLDQKQEREDHDRDDLSLPGQQESLISAVAKAAKRPVVLVLLCGGPVDVSFAKYDTKIGSILWGGYPGEAGGIALAQIIFGDHNPGENSPSNIINFFKTNNQSSLILIIKNLFFFFSFVEILFRRKINNDMVPERLHQGPDDRHEDAPGSINRISRKNIQILCRKKSF